MAASTPTPELAYYEPPAVRPGPKAFFIAWSVPNLAADTPGSISIYLGALEPWLTAAKHWVRINSFRISVFASAYTTLKVVPCFTLGLGTDGIVFLETKTIQGGYSDDAEKWECDLLTQVHKNQARADSVKRPHAQIDVYENAATDDFWVYIEGEYL